MRIIFRAVGLVAALTAYPVMAEALDFGPKLSVRSPELTETSQQARAAYHEIMSQTASVPTTTYVVSDPGDQPDDSLEDGIHFPATLRAAVENANRFPDLDMITFSPLLTMVQKTSVSWPNITGPVILDGAISDSGRIIIDGSLQAGGGGLVFHNGGSTIRNCDFRNFDTWGILLQANSGNSNIVQNCVFRDNGNAGINFNASTRNLIGGILPGERNYLCGNNFGMTLLVGSDSNRVIGNYIGTMDGETAFGNTGYGVWIQTAGNLISGNLISGNANVAVYVSDPPAKNNVIESNYMGVDKDGTTALGNAGGISLSRGGSDTIRANVISGSTSGAIGIGSNIPDVVVEENLIGTDVTGTIPIPNGGGGIGTAGRRTVIQGNLICANSTGIDVFSGDSCIIRDNIVGDYESSVDPLGNRFFGVVISGGKGHRVGGPNPGDGNMISGNGHIGVRLFGSGVTGCVVEGNLIGTGASGLTALSNDSAGVQLRTATKMDTVRNNVISGNGLDGILFSNATDTLPGQNVVYGNLIGVGIDSLTLIPNGRFGIQLDTARGNFIGLPGMPANVIVDNDSGGVRLFRSRQNTIAANLIGALPDSLSPAPNDGDGISIVRSRMNTIGGRNPDAANMIAYNSGAGIRVFSGEGNRFIGNVIRENDDIGIDLVGQDLIGGVTLNDSADVDMGPNHLQNFPTLTYIARSGGNAVVHGFLEGNEGDGYVIDFYSVDTLDPSGFGGSSELLDSLIVVPDSTGRATFVHTLATNPANIVTTATSDDGSTSEYSKPPIMVNSSGDGADVDPHDAVCNSGGASIYGVPECALRAAIALANQLQGPDYLGFEIEGTAPINVHPNSGLPTVLEETCIDGTTQPGYVLGAPGIRISGTSAGAAVGLFIDDDRSVVRGISITDFEEQGLRCTGASLRLHDVRVTGNDRTGILCNNDLVVTGKLIASLNGTQVESDAGVDVGGLLFADSVETSGNRGRGIRAGKLFLNGDLIAEDNHAAGVNVVSNILINGMHHSVTDNGYEGMSSLNGWIVVDGEIISERNGHARTPSQCRTLTTAGISATREVVLRKASISANCGYGIHSGSFVWLKDNCTLNNNTEIGLLAHGGEVRLDGTNYVISDNGKTGLLCNNGIVRVAGRLTLNNNGAATRAEEPDDCLPGLGDPLSENGQHGLYASLLEARDIIATNNCGSGIAGGEVSISGVAKLNNNSSHGVAARIIRIASGECCYNDGYGVVVLNPGGIVAGGILNLGAVKLCSNGLGGILGKPSGAASATSKLSSFTGAVSTQPSEISGSSITDNLGDGIFWQTVDSLKVSKSNISSNSLAGINAAPGSGAVITTDVWWGSADGPGGEGPGAGDEITGGVSASQWSPSMHALSLSLPGAIYAVPGEADSFFISLSKWTVGSESINVSITDTTGWVSSPHNFAIAASDTATSIAMIGVSVPGGTPEGVQAEIHVVVTSGINPTHTDTGIVAVYTYAPQLASIELIPDSVTLAPEGTASFFAFGRDQYGAAMPFLTMWSTDGGTINGAGQFTAGDQPGIYTVTAENETGTLSAEAEVHVVTGPTCDCDCHADPLCDSTVDIFDVVQVINVAFRNEPNIADPNLSCPRFTTDVNCDDVTDIFDVVLLVNVAFRNASPASEFCIPCP